MTLAVTDTLENLDVDRLKFLLGEHAEIVRELREAEAALIDAKGRREAAAELEETSRRKLLAFVLRVANLDD